MLSHAEGAGTADAVSKTPLSGDIQPKHEDVQKRPNRLNREEQEQRRQGAARRTDATPSILPQICM